jgi:tetratricopeptide (TPR) repeat protein
MSSHSIPNVVSALQKKRTARHRGKLSLLMLCAALVLQSVLPEAHGRYSDQQIRAVETNDEVEINRIRDQEINQLRIVLGRRDVGNRRPDLLLRLAELYIEKYRHFFLKENEVHQALLKEGRKPGKVDHTRSRSYLSSATNSCLAILKSRVPFSRMDQVYYFLGYNADELGRRQEAISYYRKVLQANSASQYAPEAERNIAENEFAKGRYREAVKWYERAARHTSLPSYPRNLYKLSWAYFKTKRFNDALATMKRVAEISKSNDKFIALRDEALNDLVTFYAEAGRVNEARNYFESVTEGPELFIQALKRLAQLYERSGRIALAITVTEALISAQADERPELVFDAIANSVELYRKSKNAQGEERALRRLVDFYLKHKGDIGKGDEDRNAAYGRVKAYLRGRATATHKDAQKAKNNSPVYSRAADLYGLYLQSFLSDPESDADFKERTEIRIYRADCLLAAGRDGEGFRELELALGEDGDRTKRREAGVTLLNRMIRSMDGVLKSGKREPTLEEKFFNLSKRFENIFPDDPLIPDLKFKRARLLALRASSSGPLPGDARDALEDFIAKYPTRPDSAEAVRELINEDLRLGKQADAAEKANFYLQNAAILKAGQPTKLKEYLESVVSRRAFAKIQTLEKDNEYEKAAQSYLELASSARDGEVRVKSLNNAAVSFEKAGNDVEAAKVYERLLKQKVKTVKADDALRAIAMRALLKGDYPQAARHYLHFAQLDEFSTSSRLSFYRTAIQLLWGVGQLNDALAAVRSARGYFCRKLDSSFCHDLYFWAGELADLLNNPQSAADELKAYLDKANVRMADARMAEAHFKLAQLYLKFNQSRKAQTHYEQAKAIASTKNNRSSREDKSYGAQAAFILVEPEYKRYLGLDIRGGGQEAKARTKAKLAALERLGTLYNGVVAIGDGQWGVASLERLASAFDAFAADIEVQPAPEGLTPEALEQYRRGIAQVTGPLRARATENLLTAHKKGLDLQVTTPVFYRLTMSLARRDARRYPPVIGALVTTVLPEEALVMGPVQAKIEDWRSDLQTRALAVQGALPASYWIEYGNLELKNRRPRLARLFYEEALGQKTNAAQLASAYNNLAVLLMSEGRTVEATQSLVQAEKKAEFAVEPRFNLVKNYLSHGLYQEALEEVGPLSNKPEYSVLRLVAMLGAGRISDACGSLQQMDALSRREAAYWYHGAVCAVYVGNKDKKKDALDKIKDGLGDEAFQNDDHKAMARITMSLLQESTR